ncbi:MAG: hypothetical protein ABI190_05925 [Casimicrobiaceae bacterium]
MTASIPASLPELLVRARNSGSPARLDEALLPADHAAAYAAQRAVTAALHDDVGGWKVGMLPDGTPTIAPMYARDIRGSGAQWKLPPSRALVVEVEVAMRVARDLPARPGKPYARDEVAAAMSEVLVGLELLQSRFAGDGFPPFLVNLADNLGNAGYITGGALRDFAALDLARLRCSYALDGVERHAAVGGHPQDDPWMPLLACLNAGLMGASGYRAGQIVTTGTLVPPLRVDAPSRLTATLQGIGEVAVDFVR